MAKDHSRVESNTSATRQNSPTVTPPIKSGNASKGRVPSKP